MFLFDINSLCKIGDSATDLEDSVIGTGRPHETVHRFFQQIFPGLIQSAEFVDFFRVQQVVRFSLPLKLNAPGIANPFGNRCG